MTNIKSGLITPVLKGRRQKAEGEQGFKVPLQKGEGFRVRADKGNILTLISGL
jgi:hypothetical protein